MVLSTSAFLTQFRLIFDTEGASACVVSPSSQLNAATDTALQYGPLKAGVYLAKTEQTVVRGPVHYSTSLLSCASLERRLLLNMIEYTDIVYHRSESLLYLRRFQCLRGQSTTGARDRCRISEFESCPGAVMRHQSNWC